MNLQHMPWLIMDMFEIQPNVESNAKLSCRTINDYGIKMMSVKVLLYDCKEKEDIFQILHKTTTL